MNTEAAEAPRVSSDPLRWMLTRTVAASPLPFAIRVGSGPVIASPSGEPLFELRFDSAATVARLLVEEPHTAFAQAYAEGRAEIQGDLRDLVRVAYALGERGTRTSPIGKATAAFSAIALRNTHARSPANIAAHYDLGNEFFARWLGTTMAYSCAYFQRPDDSLDTAQEAKFEHLCRKLALRPDQHLLDIGCGWGGLLIHAARHHGARGTGITLSRRQAEYATAEVARLGLADRVTIELRDYRDLAGRTFDRVVSVGMIEHVGREFLGAYCGIVCRALAPGGTAVLHTIGRSTHEPVSPWITTQVFPGMYLPTLGELADGAAAAELEVRDVENLRTHYAMTMDHWITNFEAARPELAARHSPAFLRTWHWYLSNCAGAFRWGHLRLWQVTVAHPNDPEQPLTRAAIYAGTP